MEQERLYKYLDWDNKHHRRVLTHTEIFFASARRFNDPFDCTIPPRYDLLTEENYVQLVRKYFEDENPRQSSDQINKLVNEHIQQNMLRNQRHLDWFDKHQQEAKYSEFGIFCLSAVRDNILMRSHYSDSHQGLCIGFSTRTLDSFFEELWSRDKVLIGREKVQYSVEYPELHPMKEAGGDLLKKQFISKSQDWAYEEEQRYILHKGTEKKFTLPNNVIAEVILGCRMPDDRKAEIKHLLRHKSYRIELFQAQKKEHTFGLDFDLVDY